MGNDNNNVINPSQLEEFENDEIDIKDILLSFLRNKKLISKITVLSIILGLINAYTAKKIWKGEFQIVLSSTGVNNNNVGMSGLLGGLDVSGEGDPLKTEVGILKSPLVLSKVFDYVIGKKSNSNLIFNEWKNKSLDVGLEKGTTILKISYEDQDKELIIPVLNRISKSYQEYSGRKRLRTIKLEKEFFENQINIYKEKSISSLRRSQEFAMEQNLAILQGDSEIDKEIINSINVESIRISSANKIRNIEVQLEQISNLNDAESIIYVGRSIAGLNAQGLPQKLDAIDRKLINLKALQNKINDLGNDPEKIQYYGNSIPQLVATSLPSQLNNIETTLAFKRLSYKETDKSITNLIKRRDALILIFKKKAINYLEADIQKLKQSRPPLIKLLKEKAIGFLEAEKQFQQANLKASERPEGVLLKYRQLIRNAQKDKGTLVELENNYRALLLNEAKTPDPWELITSPTLLPNPIKPIKRNILLIYLMLGLFTGAAISYIKEKRSDIIYTKSQLRNVTQLPLLLDLEIDENNSLDEPFDLLFESKLFNKDYDFAFLQIGDLNERTKISLNKIIESKINLFKVGLIDNIKDLNKYSKLIIIASFGIVKRSEITKEIQKLSLLNKEIIGMIFMNLK